ncbi:alkaline phosphatase family protein [Candidatus Omnitrophota bacterium]
MKRKVAIIGLDGASLELIKTWAAAGHLPNFQKVLSQGASGKLESVFPPHSAPAWSTLYTGKNLGKHGLFDFIALRQNTYDILPTSFADNKAQTFWDLASLAGKSCVALNLPLTYPPRPLNGIFVSGLQTPAGVSDFTYPQGLKKELDALTGGYTIYPIEFERNREAYLESLIEVTENKFKVFSHYFQQKDWDLFMCVFQGTDLIQHYFWQYMDPDHPYYQPDNKYRDVIRKYYQRMDRYLAEFLDHLDKETTLMIVSDHGFAALHKYFYINNWLYKWGMIKFKQTPKVWAKKACFALDFMPNVGKKTRHFFSFRDIDWSKTRAFSFTNTGQIFINLKGRQPQGAVEPGQEYEQVCDQIVRLLGEIKDPQTQERVIERAYKRSQIYSGHYTALLPDVFYLPNQGRYVNSGGNKFYSNKLIEKCHPEDISGGHSLYGIALFYGNGIKQNSDLEGLHLQDVAPLVLAILGIDIPKDMDGRLKPQMVQADFLGKVGFQAAQEKTSAEKFAYTQTESEEIQKRLKELGYID